MAAVKFGVQDEAKELAYDNSVSGLAATTIQQAIDLLYSTKEPANSNILKTSSIGVTVQPYSLNSPTGQTGWNDITAEITIRGAASGSPTWDQMGNNSMYAYNFGIGKKAYATFHIRHDYKPGGDILLHVHWTTSGTNTNTVKWKLDYTVAKGHNQSTGGNFFPMTTVYLEQAGSGTAWRHMVTEMATSITLTNAEVDSLILMSFERVTNGGTDNTDNIFGLTVDCHYQTDRISTVNRAPNFYGS